MSKLQPATPEDVARVELALIKLREARDLLAASGCPNSLARTRLAIKSTEGAKRHVERRYVRTAFPRL